MALLKGKYVDPNAPLNGEKIKLDNDQALKGKKADGSDKEILKVNASDKIEFASVPVVSSDPAEGDALARKSYVDAAAASAASAAVGSLDLSGKADLVDGKVPSTQLPSYVDDVLEYDNAAALPATGEAGKIYVTKDNNKTFRWSGSGYIEISASPGSTDAVAEGTTNLYFTNARAASAAPVQSVAGKTGIVTLAKGDVGLGNVDNTSDADKPISTATATALAGKQASLGTGTTSQYLRGDLTWASIPKASKVLTVGIDAATIAGCIALCTSPTATNNYIIEIPSGSYTEDLTIPGNVHLKGLANPNDSLSVKIIGQHSIQGASNNALNNRVCIANILFVSSHATTPLFAIGGTLSETEVQFTGCFLQNVNTASTAKLFNISLYGKVYINNSRLRMAGSSQGGTHFTIAAGAQLYTQYGLDTDGGTCVIDMPGQGYAQIQYGQLGCSGASAIKIGANGMVIMNQSSLTNGASVGNGVNMTGAAASFFASHTVFNIVENAASYVVTGVAGTYYGMYANNYSHIAGVVTKNTKIGPSVANLRYTGSLTSADVNDFAAAAKAAAVSDAIVDGVTNVAPSQNAVYDALALKAASVHTHTASSITDFDSAAKSAVVQDSITDGVTDKAPSQNAVYDALALKQASLGTGTTSQYLRGDLSWQTIPAGITPKKETFVLTGTDISNGYIDCAQLAVADSMLLISGGIPHIEGALEDYTLSTVSGKTRVTFSAYFLGKLSVGDRVYLQYCY